MLHLPSHLLRAVVLVLALGATAHLRAQSSVRPGSTSRGTTGSSATGNRTGISGSTGSNRSSGTGSNGQRQYPSNTQLGDATIQIDPETRSVIIVTDEETHKELDKVIQNLDRPKPQVMIKVVFLEVTYNKALDVGVEASYTFNAGKPTGAITGSTTKSSTSTGSTGNSTTTTQTTDLGAAALAANGITAGTLFGLASSTNPFVRVLADDWTATLHALSTKGKVEVLSRPSIMARNNQEAVIVVGSEVPFITNSQVTQLGNTINTIQYDNIGIILRVTPFITSKNSVEMIVAPEISALTDQSVPIGNNASSPVISKRSAETVVVTPNAHTIVIGGLMSTQHLSTVNKFPILGDIPYVGAAFRHTVKSDVKSELMIFLTPFIVENPVDMENLNEHEMQDNELVPKAFTKTEFDRFVDGPSLYPEGDVPAEPKPLKVTTTVKKSVTSQAPPTAPAPGVPVAPAAVPATPAPKSKPSGSTRSTNPKF